MVYRQPLVCKTTFSSFRFCLWLITCFRDKKTKLFDPEKIKFMCSIDFKIVDFHVSFLITLGVFGDARLRNNLKAETSQDAHFHKGRLK